MIFIVAAFSILTSNSTCWAWSSSKPDLHKYFDMSYKKENSDAIDPQVLPEYQAPYSKLMDFARLENEKPLDKAFLQSLTVAQVMEMDQEMADQLYARLTAGPIPDGVFDGEAKLLKGSMVLEKAKIFTGTLPEEVLGEKIGGLIGDAASALVGKQIEMLSNYLWKGKHFYREERILRNVIPYNIAAGLALGLIVKDFDYKKLPVKKVVVKGKEVNAWELFPAKLYCGQSLLDSRRESVIIDYAYSDHIAGYDDSIDFLASRNGVYVRDEIRMIRPGFYLGKAYLAKQFFLTFTLYNAAADKAGHDLKQWPEDCWTGKQAHEVR